MATKKPMKKSRRYEEGGEVTVDEPKTRRISFNPDGSRTQSFAEQIASRQQTGGDQAGFKKSGLEASNKEKPVGFFERLRMGNIDEVGSEAYNKFGAGRGRAMAPVPATKAPPSLPEPKKVSIGSSDEQYENDRAKRRAMARSFDMQQDISAGSDFISRPQDEGYRPNAGTASERAMLEGAFDSDKITENTGPRTKPIEITPAKPPKPPKPKVTDTGDESARLLARYKKPALRQETVNERAKRFIEKREAAKREKEANPARGRSGVAYAKGGSVSSASKRADGIATKGKTRGRMC